MSKYTKGDIRNELSIDKHQKHHDAEPVSPDSHISVRFMTPDEARALSICVFHSYGPTYDADWVYQPKQITKKIKSGKLKSCVGISEEGEIVGHLGLTLESLGSRVGEAGQAVVDLRYRGHHLFTTMKKYTAEWAKQEGMYGIFSEATAAHPYSQKANLSLGATETGILLGYIPASVNYQAINKAAKKHRLSVVLFYLKTNQGHKNKIYAPPHHREIIELIYHHSGLSGSIVKDVTEPDLPEKTDLHSYERADHNQLCITVLSYGKNFLSRIKSVLSHHMNKNVDCIYVDLPLSAPATTKLGEELEDLGFFFGGVFPNLQVSGDVLRLQKLHNVEVTHDDVSVASEFGERLLNYILDRSKI
jgi:serine/threonine-protein kinase RsbW